MKAQLGSIITSASGRLGGTTFCMHKKNVVVRPRRPKSSNPSRQQAIVFSNLQKVKKAWRLLSQANKNKWVLAVSEKIWQSSNPYSSITSAYSLFTKLNMMRLRVALSILNTPPVCVIPPTITVTSVTCNIGTQRIAFTFSIKIPANCYLVIYASKPYSPSITKAPNNYKLMSVVNPNFSGTFLVSAGYTSRFGSFGSVGHKIFFKVHSVNSTSGTISPVLFYSCVTLP